MHKFNPPSFVRLGKNGTAMRLLRDFYTDKWVYHRDGGQWEIGFAYHDTKNKFVSHSSIPHLNDIELIEISQEEWAKDNRPYAPINITNNLDKEKIKRELNTIIGGYLKGHPELTISALKKLVEEL